jgi:hypothetical protein
MAEIQRSAHAGELAQQFIEFIMMQAQQAALCLGQIPHPSTGKAEVNLEAARMFIDHLEIIKEKTRGNLSPDEDKILTSILSELQLAFVHVADKSGNSISSEFNDKLATPPAELPVSDEVSSAPETTFSETSPTVSPSEEEGKKKFTKSYGA